MRLVIVSDAWTPQVNGVVRTFIEVSQRLRAAGHDVLIIEPGMFRTFPCPGYPEIRLVRNPGQLDDILDDADFETVHIATEGPLGWRARRYCLRRGLVFTTSYHTKFPEYLHERFRIPVALTYAFVRRFHAPAEMVLVPTQSSRADLAAHGFGEMTVWGGGVDSSRFSPPVPPHEPGRPPVFLNVGRVAKEKNLEAFYRLELPGRKVQVGDGPELETYRKRYPEVEFLGLKCGDDLVAAYQSADVFVFPSRTDTFGLVLVEAMAAGLPVAAFDVTGPRDIVVDGVSGFLSEDLKSSCLKALDLDQAACVQRARDFSWERVVDGFVAQLVTARRQGYRLVAEI